MTLTWPEIRTVMAIIPLDKRFGEYNERINIHLGILSFIASVLRLSNIHDLL
jgi:hypothetical protein